MQRQRPSLGPVGRHRQIETERLDAATGDDQHWDQGQRPPFRSAAQDPPSEPYQNEIAGQRDHRLHIPRGRWRRGNPVPYPFPNQPERQVRTGEQPEQRDRPNRCADQQERIPTAGRRSGWRHVLGRGLVHVYSPTRVDAALQERVSTAARSIATRDPALAPIGRLVVIREAGDLDDSHAKR